MSARCALASGDGEAGARQHDSAADSSGGAQHGGEADSSGGAHTGGRISSGIDRALIPELIQCFGCEKSAELAAVLEK